MHRAQVAVLATLRHQSEARFSDLQSEAGMTSDAFKFHIRTLMRSEYIQKRNDGLYQLTPRGKEYANRLDEAAGAELAQPKVSMLLCAVSQREGEIVYLAHKRKRQPFYEFWGIGSAPLARGMTMNDSAHAEFLKQTGISADFVQLGTLRVIDTDPRSNVLEDKLFLVMKTKLMQPTEPHDWYAGESVWLTKTQLLAKKNLFPTTALTLDIVEAKRVFGEYTARYQDGEY